MNNKKSVYSLSVLLLIALVATYSNHFYNSFHFDDMHTVVNNISIRSLRNIPLFFEDAATFSSLPSNQVYRPVVVTSLALDYYLGKGLHPFYFHLSMFVLFIVQGLFMYMLYSKVFQQPGKHTGKSIVALCAVAWYMLHPANAETINYISARSDTLSTLFGLISMVLFIYSAFCRKWLLYLIPLTIAVLAKPIAIFFVLLLMVYIYLFEDASAGLVPGKEKTPSSQTRAVVKKTWPALLFALLLMIFTKAMTPPTFTPGGAPFFNYVITQPYVILHYFTTFLLPISLSADTDWKPLSSVTDPSFFIGTIFIAVLLYLAAATAKNRKTRPISFGILWFLITLLPTSLFPLAEVMNDHRIFFPYVGLTMSICWSIFLALEKIKKSFSSEETFYRTVLVVIIIVLTGYAYGTYARNIVWKTDESLWHDVTQKSPKNGRGLMNYGLALMAKTNYAGAEKYFSAAMQLTPNYSYLYTNMGILKMATGKINEAEPDFKKAIALNPDNPTCYFFYAKFLNSLKRYDEAVQNLTKTLELASNYLDARHLLASIYYERNQFDKLRALAEQTLLIAPDDRQTAYYLMAMQSGKTRLDVTKEEADRNKTPESLLNLSLEYYNAGKYAESIAAAQEALMLRPDYDLAFTNICAAYNELGQWDKAIEAGENAVKLNPNNQLAQNNLNAAKEHRRSGRRPLGRKGP
jgi:tetratricopeptide (TPR) repeat protein